MVIGGAEGGENKGGEHDNVKPALASVREFLRARSEEEDQAPDSNDGEGEIGGYVAEVRNAEPGALVGEVVVGEGLRDWRKEMGDSRNYDRDREQEQMCFGARNHGVRWGVAFSTGVVL